MLQYLPGGQKHLGMIFSYLVDAESLESAALHTRVFPSLLLSVVLRLQPLQKWVLQALDKTRILGLHYKHLDLLNHLSADS